VGVLTGGGDQGGGQISRQREDKEDKLGTTTKLYIERQNGKESTR
jgi:hypothetical protein